MSDLSQQVAALEARYDAEIRRAVAAENALIAAESALAQARVEGAREALTRFHDELHPATLGTGPNVPPRVNGLFYFAKSYVPEFRDREYPASPRAEPTGGELVFTPGSKGAADHCSKCGFFSRDESWAAHLERVHSTTLREWNDRGNRPNYGPRPATPDAGTPERVVTVAVEQDGDGELHVEFTPTLAARLVSLARTSGGADA